MNQSEGWAGGTFLAQARFERVQAFEENLVVVAGAASSLLVFAAAPGVARDPGAAWGRSFGREWLIAVITRKTDDCGAGPWERNGDALADESAGFIATLEITHRSGAACIDPIGIATRVAILLRVRQRDDPGLVKASVLSPAANVFSM